MQEVGFGEQPEKKKKKRELVLLSQPEKEVRQAG